MSGVDGPDGDAGLFSGSALTGSGESDTAGSGASGARPRLSVCVIARNEARFLPGCLESVRDWADEIVVIDTGSSDATPDIARRSGARVFHEVWANDFSRARNAAIERATGDWILALDADERLDYINGSRLLRLIAESPRDLDAYQLRIVSVADRVDSGVELVHFYPRLFRRHPAIRYRGALHEQVVRGDVPVGPRSPRVPLNIYHLGYADPEKNQIRLRRNHQIALDEASDMPEEPTALMNLADTCVMVGDLKRAEDLYLRLLKGRDLGPLGANVAWNLAVCRFKAGETARALADLDQVAENFPDLMGTRFLKAQLLMDLKRHGEAIHELDILLDGTFSPDPRVSDIRPNLAFVESLKGVCLVVEGRLAEGEQAFESALERDPQLFAGHAHRADLMMTLGRPHDALAGYLRAAALRPDNGTVRLRAGLILLDLGRRSDGQALIAEAGRLDPTCGPTAVVFLEALKLEAGGLPWREALTAAQRGGSAGAPTDAAGAESVRPEFSPGTDSGVASAGPAEAPPAASAAEPSEPVEYVLDFRGEGEGPAASDLSQAAQAPDPTVTSEPVAATPRVVESDLPGSDPVAAADDTNDGSLMSGGGAPATERAAAVSGDAEGDVDSTLTDDAADEGGYIRLSVCIIARNEAERLGACLDSVAGVADEIVVCDTGSTDDTIAVARTHRARVLSVAWEDDFAAARNAALDAARGEWVLVLDADERLTPISATRLPALLMETAVDGYNVAIESLLKGDLINRFVGNYCRLFRRHPDVRFEGRVHEQIYPSLRRLARRVVPSDLVIEHEGYALEPEVMRQKKLRNLALLEMEYAERPHDHFVQFNLGVAWFSLLDLNRAEPFFRSAVRQTGETLPPEVLALALARLAQCALDRGDLDQSAHDARTALGIDPQAAIPRFVLATIAYRNERYLEAAAEFRRLLDAGVAANGDGVDRADVERELGVCLYRGARYAEAAQTFENLVRLRPEDARAHLLLGTARARTLELPQALEAFRRAVALQPDLREARGNYELVAVEYGYRLHDEGRYEEALAVVPEETENTELLFLGAISHFARQDFLPARVLLERMNGIDASYAEAHWNLALVCRALGDYQAARISLLRFRQLAPTDPRADRLESALASESSSQTS